MNERHFLKCLYGDENLCKFLDLLMSRGIKAQHVLSTDSNGSYIVIYIAENAVKYLNI